ncbi:DM13 domain-containing protein [Kitasatospora atroaurantiaca]|uniref:Electron transfer DM13 n=1 Tax=Kitasatospora atroaurantiaca TaxID=285545 RepID=A0A561F0H9_9ACTN|nr:DM13 domain-containing protein [Kitasatospora atroaurantiaca]TWE21368.1 electron transfer DM13 [Kitasatospora atroaurantiaca]
MPNTRRRRPLLGIATVAVLLAAAVGLYLFQPWKAFTNTTVDEALPAVTATTAPTSTAAAAPPSASPDATRSTSGPADLARGTFRSGEHATTGTARLVRLPDGSTVLRLEDLDTSDGPDVHVYLSTAPATESKSDHLGAKPLELDRLKGNHGNQNYAVPAGTDLTAYRSAVIWCKRFSVGFGAADLTPVPS